MKNHIICILALSALLLASLAACAPQTPAISVETAWGKPSTSVAGAGAFYMVIKNTGPAGDKLISAKSSACGMTELHNTVKADDGTMKMVLVTDGVDVPAGSQLELKTGSYHIMCMKMQADQLAAGAKPAVTLVFDKSGEKTVTLEMKSQ